MLFHRSSTVLSILLLTSCGLPFTASPWQTQIVLEHPNAKFGGCGVGDLLTEHQGAEIAVTAADGSVYVIHRDGGVYGHELAWRAPGEIVQCTVGDADPTRPGSELVGVGMAEGDEDSGGNGAVYLLYAQASDQGGHTWHSEVIHTEGSLVHGVTIVDGAVWTAGFDAKLRRIYRTANGWATDPAVECTLPGAGKAVLALDSQRIAVACTDGSVVLATPNRGRWSLRVLHRRQPISGRARLATDGSRVVVADDDGSLYLLRPREKGPRHAELLYKDDKKLRGAVIADLEPSRDGLEIATAGYSGRLTLLTEPRTGRADRGAWDFMHLHEDESPLHHLLAAEIDGNPGLDLVSCGFAGKVYVLSRATTR